MLFKFIHCLLCTLILTPLFSDPWGIDANLCKKNKHSSHQAPFLFKSSVLSIIRFHQQVLSPTDGPRSHFYPSSSQYSLIAYKKYGFLWGTVLTFDRLLRENNDQWMYLMYLTKDKDWLKYNPVPCLHL